MDCDEFCGSKGTNFCFCFTAIFAPTDAAFAKLSNLDAILDNANLLTLILQYHVVPGKFLASDLTDGQVLTTLASRTLTVSASADGTVTLNGGAAEIVLTDIEGSNGVVHGISDVLIPDGTTASPASAPTTAAPVEAPSDPGVVLSTEAPGSGAASSTMLLALSSSMVLLVVGFL
jgi:hypothetical protein